MAGESDKANDNGASAGKDTTVQVLEALLDLATTVIQAAHETAVAAVPDEPGAQLARANNLRQAGTDLTAIAEACDVAVRYRDG